MRRMMLAALVLLGLVAPRVEAQRSLEAAAEQARRAWAGHRPADLVGRGGKVGVSLPGSAPAEALEAPQAVALFEDLFRRAEEQDVRIRTVRETAPGEGYVELSRRFRPAGTQEVREQSVLLEFRYGEGRWRLREVRLID